MRIDEVKRISLRMKEILDMLGYDKTKSVGELMNELNENPDFLYADTPDRKEIVKQIIQKWWTKQLLL